MDNKDLHSVICTSLMRIGIRMATEFDHRFSDLGLTQAQFRILLAVGECGGEQGVAPSTLAETLLIERGTVSVMTGHMVNKGWLARQSGENRRTFRLVLTGEGRAILQQAIPRAINLARKTLAYIPAEQLQMMNTHLEKVEKVLREHIPQKE